MQKSKKQLRESFQDDINEFSIELQNLLIKGFSTGILNEEDIIAEIDDMDLNIKTVEKVYDIADKLGIKILTIEEVLEREAQAVKKESRL
ncbi:TPA: hypothetical protein DIC40_03250 [Patescibacteria group bacterium]|nr:hypothetical protein [Candidatus Gracilibacteria bacterium]